MARLPRSMAVGETEGCVPRAAGKAALVKPSHRASCAGSDSDSQTWVPRVLATTACRNQSTFFPQLLELISRSYVPIYLRSQSVFIILLADELVAVADVVRVPDGVCHVARCPAATRGCCQNVVHGVGVSVVRLPRAA